MFLPSTCGRKNQTINNASILIALQKARLRRDGFVNGLQCGWLQDAGGTSAYTQLPDTQAISYGITNINESIIQL